MRILFTWEMGSNYGHLARLIPLAKAQIAKGHSVQFAVTDLEAANKMILPCNIAFTIMPRMVAIHRSKTLAANYAEMLMHIGYDNLETLSKNVAKWVEYIKDYQPDLLVADYSPTAIIASRIANVEVIQLGGGFEIPPKEEWSVMVPLNKMQKIGVRMTERQLLGNINHVLQAHGSASLNAVEALFNHTHQLLTTFAELDHYPHRRNAHYIGPIYTMGQGKEVLWTSSTAKKIFVYAWPGLPGLNQLMLTLGKMDVEVVAVIPKLTDEALLLFTTKNIRIFREPINFSELVSQADLLITHSGFGTVSAFLKAGVPVLIIPETLEQLIIGQRVTASGLGLMIGRKRSAEVFVAAISELLNSPDYKRLTETFSAKYSHWSDDEAIKQTSLKIEEVLNGKQAKQPIQMLPTIH